MIKIEFPANRTDIARAVATMLNSIADGNTEATASNIVKNVTTAEKKRLIEEAPTLDEQAVADLEYDPADCASNEYEQAAIDALLGEDEALEFSLEDVAKFGANLKFAYDNMGRSLVSLSVAAEVMVDLGGVVQILSDTGLVCKALNQSFEQEAPDTTDAKVDTNGVAFCDKHCATAADPFYGSGKMRGQWKKKRRVDQPTYDAWYESARPTGTTTEETPIDTTQAFSGQQSTAPAADVPANLGALMAWVSAQQTAEVVTKEQVTAAYTQCGIADIASLFTATPEAQTGYIAAIFGVLSA